MKNKRGRPKRFLDEKKVLNMYRTMTQQEVADALKTANRKVKDILVRNQIKIRKNNRAKEIVDPIDQFICAQRRKGATYRQIAAVLGRHPETVRQRYTRIRKRIKNEIIT